VTAPTIWAPEAAIAILVIGLIVAYVMPGKPGTGTRAADEFAGLSATEQAPQKL